MGASPAAVEISPTARLDPGNGAPGNIVAGEVAPRNVVTITAATFLATASAAWMAGGLFDGASPRLLALAGLVVGVAPVAWAYRRQPPSSAQLLVVPAAVVVGTGLAILVGTPHPSMGELPRLVGDSLRSGALGGGAAVPLDPGWRFLLVTILALVGAAAASVALHLGRARVGVAVGAPLAFMAALRQPKGVGAAAGVGTVVALIAALGIAASADGGTGPARQRGRGHRRPALVAVLLVVLAVSVAGISRVGFLFPASTRDRTNPTGPVAPLADRVVFRVRSDQPGPWRLQVFDRYADGGFSAAPEGARLQALGLGGSVPGASATTSTSSATFTVVDLAGTVLPSPANPTRVSVEGILVGYSQQTQLLKVSRGDVPAGTTYTVDAPSAPAVDALRQAPPPPPSMRTFLSAPPAPPEVAALLTQASATTRWDRLQFALAALAEHVVTIERPAAAAPVPPGAVVAMLAGAQASPLEITTANALLARWSGIPSRVAVGYFGTAPGGQDYPVRASQKVSWVELYFDGVGWVPTIGLPASPPPTVSSGPGHATGVAVPDSRQFLTIYVPVELRRGSASAELVRYWTLFGLALAGGGGVIWWWWPAPRRGIRRWRRRRWARGQGPAALIAVAYAEFRDAATDLNVGRPAVTPLEFLAVIEADDEHTELAWLVTRTLWGDLRRDLEAGDADNARAMARSVTHRLRKAVPAATRLLAVGSRASLRHPYTDAVPTSWLPPDRWRGWPVGAAAVLTAAFVVATLVATSGDGRGPPTSPLPLRIVPDSLGSLAFHRETAAEADFVLAGPRSLVTQARIFILRDDKVRGYLEVAALRPGVDANRTKERLGILRHLGSGQYQPQRTPQGRVYVGRLQDQTVRLWFSPSGHLFELLVAGPALGDGADAFDAILGYQQTGRTTNQPSMTPTTADLRQGRDLS